MRSQRPAGGGSKTAVPFLPGGECVTSTTGNTPGGATRRKMHVSTPSRGLAQAKASLCLRFRVLARVHNLERLDALRARWAIVAQTRTVYPRQTLYRCASTETALRPSALRPDCPLHHDILARDPRTASNRQVLREVGLVLNPARRCLWPAPCADAQCPKVSGP